MRVGLERHISNPIRAEAIPMDLLAITEVWFCLD